AGLHGGRNWQFQNYVVGLEGDFSWSGERRSRDGAGAFSAAIGTFTVSTVESQLNTWKLRWFGTFRGRLGLVSEGWLVYVTGGAAVGRAQYDHTQSTTASIITGGAVIAQATVAQALSEGRTRWGYAAGAGIERAFAANWIGRFEYLYVDLGSTTFL